MTSDLSTLMSQIDPREDGPVAMTTSCCVVVARDHTYSPLRAGYTFCPLQTMRI